jgi:hypothetical protein
VVKKEISFEVIAKKLKSEGSAQGFRALRDYLLANYAAFKHEFSPLGLINLAITADKHAIFADMSAEKSKEHEQIRWRSFQDYLNGKVAAFEMPTEDEDDEFSIQEGEQGSEDGSHADSSGHGEGGGPGV